MMRRCAPGRSPLSGVRSMPRAPPQPCSSLNRPMPARSVIFASCMSNSSSSGQQPPQLDGQPLAAAAEQLGRAAVEHAYEALLGPCAEAVALLRRIAASNDRLHLEAMVVAQTLEDIREALSAAKAVQADRAAATAASKPSPDLAQPLQALAQAVSDLSQASVPRTLFQEALAELQGVASSIQAATATVGQLEARAEELKASVASMEATIRAGAQAARQYDNSLDNPAVRQTLHLAIGNAHFVEFQYYDQANRLQGSAEFIRAILFSFLARRGHWIPRTYTMTRTSKVSDADRKEFNRVVAEHITTLTGVQARVVKEVNSEDVEQYIIHDT